MSVRIGNRDVLEVLIERLLIEECDGGPVEIVVIDPGFIELRQACRHEGGDGRDDVILLPKAIIPLLQKGLSDGVGVANSVGEVA